MSYIQVVKFEHAKDGMELPLEDDNTLDMATLTSQFPNAIGLKFKAESGAWRALKVNACIISPPADGWSDSVKYVVTYKDDHKRKADEEESRLAKKSALLNHPQDLVVLNMPYETTEDEMRAFFEKYGEIAFIQMKKKPSGESRGFGFIRFVELQDQKACLAETHKMGDRTLEVKIPQSRAAGFDEVVEHSSGAQRLSRRVHVSNITTRITRKDLEEYFQKFGPITDIFIPKETETRKTIMYAFLTFDDEKDARDLVESSKPHLIHGDTLNVAYASPIVKDGNKKKTAHGFFEDMMAQYMSRAMDGYFGNDKPASKTEAIGMAMAVMRRWIERNGGPVYEERMRGLERYRHEEYATAWSGMSAYGGASFADPYGSGKYKW